jgi:hypothetical protein
MRRITVSCWKSFSPKMATSGSTMWNSLATTVATPSKCPGRNSPHRMREMPGTSMRVALLAPFG